MSKPLFSWREAVLKSQLPAPAKHVLLTLSCYMNDLGESCFPSVETIARDTSMTKKTVIKHINTAQDWGFLQVGVHGFGGQRWRSHEYTVSVPEGGVTATPAPEKGGVNGSRRWCNSRQKVVYDVHPISTENSSNNSTGKRSQKFQKPTVNQIQEYCRQRENNIDPQAFVDWYESTGWMVGKNKMKDWKAAVRTWERRQGKPNQSDNRDNLLAGAK